MNSSSEGKTGHIIHIELYLLGGYQKFLHVKLFEAENQYLPNTKFIWFSRE